MRRNSAASVIIPKNPGPSNPLGIKRLEAKSAARRALLETSDASALYPRIRADPLTSSFSAIIGKYSEIEPKTNLKDDLVTIRGEFSTVLNR